MRKRFEGNMHALLLLAVLVLLAACAAPTAPTETAADTHDDTVAAQDAVEIRFSWWGSAQRHELYDDLIDMFEADHPHITVIREPATWDDYWSRFATQAASGSLPDVLQFTPAQIVEYVDRGVVLPLDSFAETGQIDLSDLDDAVIESGRVDGNLYMISKGTSAPAIFTNVDVMERNGIEVPEADLTWDEFIGFATHVSEVLGDGVWALEDSGGNENVFESFVRQHGETLLSQDGNSLGFSRETLTKWYTIFEMLREANAIPPAEIMAEEGGRGFEDSMLVHGRVAMHFSNGNQLKIYQRFIAGGDNLELLRVPRNPDGPVEYGEIITGAYLSISANTPHTDAVAALIDYWTNNVAFNALYNNEHGIVGSEAIHAAIELDPSDQKVLDNMNAVFATAPPTLPRPIGSLLIMPLIGQNNQAIAFGQATIEEAVENVFVEGERLLQ